MVLGGFLALATLVAAVYAPVVRNGFLADDFDWLASCRRAVASGTLPHDVNGHWRPLVDAVWLLEFRAFGFDPRGYHLVAIALHLLAAWAVALGLRAAVAGGTWTVALVAGGLFAVNACHRTTATWISALPDLLLGLSGACAVALWWSARGRPGRSSLALVALFLALAAKETGLAVGGMMILGSLLLPRAPRQGWVPGVVVAIAAALQAPAVANNAYLNGRFALGWHVPGRLAESIAGLVLPLSGPTSGVLVGLGVALVGTLVLAAAAQDRRATAVLALGTFVALAPATLARDASETRWLYLPLVTFAGIAAMAAVAAADAAGRWLGRPRLGGAILVLVLVAHVASHGVLVRLKIARDAARAAWLEAYAAEVVLRARATPAGTRVYAVVRAGTEPRWWPLSAALQLGQERSVEAGEEVPREGGWTVLDLRPWQLGSTAPK